MDDYSCAEFMLPSPGPVKNLLVVDIHNNPFAVICEMIMLESAVQKISSNTACYSELI